MSTRWPPRITPPSSGGGGGPVVLAGDATGPSNANTVEAIQGNPVSAAAPDLGDVLVWDGAQWVPQPQGGSAIVSPAGAWTVDAGVAVGELVYVSGAFTADEADNTSLATGPAIGVVVAKPSAVTATIGYRGQISVFGGLVPGAIYYLGTAGGLTTSAPATVGNVIQRIGVAADATTMILDPVLVNVVL